MFQKLNWKYLTFNRHYPLKLNKENFSDCLRIHTFVGFRTLLQRFWHHWNLEKIWFTPKNGKNFGSKFSDCLGIHTFVKFWKLKVPSFSSLSVGFPAKFWFIFHKNPIFWMLTTFVIEIWKRSDLPPKNGEKPQNIWL